MPSHSERVRANYKCPTCDGTGRCDDFEGEYTCYVCKGAGILLTPEKPAPRSDGPLSAMEYLIIGEAHAVLERNCAFANQVNRPYDDPAGTLKVGDIITIRTPRRYNETDGPPLTPPVAVRIENP